MVSIKTNEDVENLEKTMTSCPLIARFLKDYIISITSQYPNDLLSDYGSFYFLETIEDVKNHTTYHLSRPLKESLNEFAEVFTIQRKDETVKIIHAVFIISDSFAVSVFAKDGLLDSDTLQHLFEERIEDRTVMIDI